MPELSYLNFDLRLESSGDKYLAYVIYSPAGEARREFVLPFSDLEIENYILKLGRPRGGIRSVETAEMQVARQFGSRLFEAVFAGDIYIVFRSSQEGAEREGKGLRIRLHIEDPILNNLPWEYLYDPRLNRFLSLSTSTLVVRYTEFSQSVPPGLVTFPLKILVVISSPDNLPAIDIEREWQVLVTALESLERRDMVVLERLEDASIMALQRRLRRTEYHILHFIGHGAIDYATDAGVLLFTDQEGQGRPVDGHTLGTVLADHRTLHLVVLAACEGARSSTENPFASIVQTLVLRGIPAVVGMQFEISDKTAVIFEQEFYSALADGYPVDASVTEARKAIYASANNAEWGTPVLHMRIPDGKLFEISSQATSVQAPEVLVSEDQQKRLEELYTQGLSAYYIEDWTPSRSYFRQILEIQPDYRDVRSRLQEIERRISAQQLIDAARQASERIPSLITHLAQYKTLAEISGVLQEFDWLPTSLISSLEDDIKEILPELLRIAKDISSSREADLYGRRLGLRDALAGLESLEERLKTLVPSSSTTGNKESIWERLPDWLARILESQKPIEQPQFFARWLPVVQCWQKIILAELKTLEQQTPSVEMENPYEVGTPLRLNRKTLFKGRMALRDAVVIALRESSRPTLVLHGPRRMGKTSFLLQLPALLPGKTIPVFIDLQRPAMTSSDSAFFYNLARSITEGAKPYLLNIPMPVRERFDERPYEAFDIWLYDIVIPRLQDNNILLCLDEFEKAGKGLDTGKLTVGVLDELRHLIQHQEKMALLFAGVQTLDELGPNWSSYFINVRSITISYLEKHEAEELIRNPDPEMNFPLKYADEVVDRILAETLGHPYLLQLVCSCIVEQANKRLVVFADENLVNAGMRLALERGEPYFRNVWDEMAGQGGKALLRQVAASPSALALTPTDSISRQALERMVQLKVLHKSTKGYTVEVPLIARWVNEYAVD